MTQALPDQVGPAAALYFVAWVVGSPCLTPSISHPNPIPNPNPNPSPNLSPNPNQVGGVYILLSLFMAVILDSFEDKVCARARVRVRVGVRGRGRKKRLG